MAPLISIFSISYLTIATLRDDDGSADPHCVIGRRVVLRRGADTELLRQRAGLGPDGERDTGTRTRRQGTQAADADCSLAAGALTGCYGEYCAVGDDIGQRHVAGTIRTIVLDRQSIACGLAFSYRCGFGGHGDLQIGGRSGVQQAVTDKDIYSTINVPGNQLGVF